MDGPTKRYLTSRVGPTGTRMTFPTAHGSEHKQIIRHHSLQRRTCYNPKKGDICRVDITYLQPVKYAPMECEHGEPEERTDAWFST